MAGKQIVERAKKHGGKIASGSIAAVMVWALGQFPTQREHDDLKRQVELLHETVDEMNVDIVVLQAIRRNQQYAERQLYE